MTSSPVRGSYKPILELDIGFEKIVRDCRHGETSNHNGRNGKSINLVFSDVSYSVRAGMLLRGKKLILGNISGDFRSGQLTAIMGQSGAGKSTLMDILAGYKTQAIGGKVMINGEDRDLASFRRTSAYIMQNDFLQPLLTIQEAMEVAANLKLRSTHREKMQRVEEILVAMGLTPHRHTRTDCLSGGQRKRLAIALELVNNPPIMFFDEPVSGLDSVSSKACLTLLNTFARQGRTVIFTIHQPSATLFNMIDHLYVIASGRCVYTGGTRALVPFLANHDLHCPTYHNPADYLMEVCNGDYGDYVQKLTSSIDNGMCNDWRSSSVVDWTKIEEMIASLNFQIPVRASPITPLYCEKLRDQIPAYYATGFFTQLCTLVRRNVIRLSRDRVLTFMRLTMHCIIALMVGSIYFKIGEDGVHVKDNFSLLFFSLMFLMFSAFSATIVTYPSELPIVTREHFNRWYRLGTFYLANKIADFPVQLLAAGSYTIIVYFMTGQLIEARRLGLYILICLCVSLVAQMIGILCGTGLDVKNGVIFGPLFIMPFVIFSGFFIHLHDAHPYLQWIFHISFLKYGFEGVMMAIYGFGRPKLPCSEIYCHWAVPEKLMLDMDMENSSYWFSMSFLAGLYLMLDIAAYTALRIRLKLRF